MSDVPSRTRKAEQSETTRAALIAAARELFALARADSRIGFESSNHYYYVPQDLIEKAINCDYVLQRVHAGFAH